MLRIDTFEFVVAVTALVLGLALLPRAWGRIWYLLFSASALVLLLPGWPSLVLAVVFLYSPPLVWLLARRRFRLVFPIWLALQALLVLWVRRYAAIVPELSGSPLVDHGLALVGISYMILRQVEWLQWLDAEYGDGEGEGEGSAEQQPSLIDYSNHLFGFLTLLAGPILSYREFTREFLARPAWPSAGEGLAALERVVVGYLKVSLLGPLLQRLSTVDFVLGQPPSLLTLASFLYLYPLFIYVNFSGYTDVVIGLGRLAGFALPENFRNPFFAPNVQEFWQRWHMTFSAWVRTVLFFPLLAALRRGLLRRRPALALTVVTLLSFGFVGLWHGPTTGFLLFGVLHGLAVLAVQPYQALLRRLLGAEGLARYERHRGLRVVRVLVCFHFLCLTISLFDRSPGIVLSVIEHALQI